MVTFLFLILPLRIEERQRKICLTEQTNKQRKQSKKSEKQKEQKKEKKKEKKKNLHQTKPN